jgi:hypothetical protein
MARQLGRNASAAADEFRDGQHRKNMKPDWSVHFPFLAPKSKNGQAAAAAQPVSQLTPPGVRASQIWLRRASQCLSWPQSDTPEAASHEISSSGAQRGATSNPSDSSAMTILHHFEFWLGITSASHEPDHGEWPCSSKA